MKTITKLNNNYYIEFVDNTDKLPIELVNIKNINIINILQKKKIILKIDFNEFSKKDYKKILKNLLFQKQVATLLKKNFGSNGNENNIVAYIFNFDNNNVEQKNFISALNAIFQKNKFERYNYIYDTVCEYLDSYFYGKNLCDFKNNKCGEKRNTSSTTGCCHHFKHKALGPFSKLVLCEYLNSETYTCDAKCLPCKLFTCDYLESKGIKFRIKDILLLDVFFNPLQKYFIKYMVYTPKEKIIKRLLWL